MRNWLKINATVENAKAYLAVQKEFGSFDGYMWAFVKGKAIPRKNRKEGDCDKRGDEPGAEKRGFKFVGATICFAFMQAVGMVNDHEPGCFRAKL